MLQIIARASRAMCGTALAVVATTGVMVSSAVAAANSPTFNVIDLAVEIGISAESVVVTGIAEHCGEMIETILLRLEQSASEAAALDQLRQQSNLLSSELTSIATAIADGEEGLNQAHEAVKDDIASLELQIDDLLQDLAANVLEGLPSAQLVALEKWRVSARYAVPAEFRTMIRDHLTWSAIESAIRAEKRSLRTGEPLAAHHSGLLADVRAEVGVIQAAFWLNEHVAQVNNLFEQY